MNYLKVLCAFSIVSLIACSENPVTAPLSPVGDWFYTDQVVFNDENVPENVTIKVKSDNTFQTIGLVSNGSVTITYFVTSGIWSFSGNSVTFNSNNCQLFDETTSLLAAVDCASPYTLVLNGDKMTDGSLIISRK